MEKIKTIAIIGMGLIGGSLGMAIKNKDLAEKVVGVSRNIDNLKEAKEKEALDDFSTDPIEASKDADIVFICTPISLIIPTIIKILPTLKKGAIITDVGSSKLSIVNKIDLLMPEDIYFVGGHPMAGNERSGIKAATKFLFDGANYILTPSEKTNRTALNVLKDFIKKLDVETIVMPPDKHDLAVAGISHMPLAIAVSLVNTIGQSGSLKEDMIKLASSGFRDTTRIAAGNVEMGKDMFTTNKDAVLEMIKGFKSSLEKLEKNIRNSDNDKIEEDLIKAQKLRTDMYAS